MNYIKCLLLFLLLAGCDTNLTQEQKQKIRRTRTKISCLTPDGWVDHYTIEGEAFWRGGWSFHNLEGDKIQSSMCQRVFKLKTRKVK